MAVADFTTAEEKCITGKYANCNFWDAVGRLLPLTPLEEWVYEPHMWIPCQQDTHSTLGNNWCYKTAGLKGRILNLILLFDRMLNTVNKNVPLGLLMVKIRWIYLPLVQFCLCQFTLFCYVPVQPSTSVFQILPNLRFCHLSLNSFPLLSFHHFSLVPCYWSKTYFFVSFHSSSP